MSVIDDLGMPNMNQVEVPQSFMALFVTAGRLKPNVSLEVVVSRYEICEDMACMLTEHAQTILSNLDLTEEVVLLRCHEGLLSGESAFTEQESGWIVYRLAELLSWTPPEFGEVGSSYSRQTP
ncbi:MAG: ATPase with chaperone activity [Deltaproteobacteria bacterium]|jgi:hypothetical protein